MKTTTITRIAPGSYVLTVQGWGHRAFDSYRDAQRAELDERYGTTERVSDASLAALRADLGL